MHFNSSVFGALWACCFYRLFYFKSVFYDFFCHLWRCTLLYLGWFWSFKLLFCFNWGWIRFSQFWGKISPCQNIKDDFPVEVVIVEFIMIDPGELGSLDDLLKCDDLFHQYPHFLFGEVREMLLYQGVCGGPQNSQPMHFIWIYIEFGVVQGPFLFFQVKWDEVSNIF